MWWSRRGLVEFWFKWVILTFWSQMLSALYSESSSWSLGRARTAHCPAAPLLRERHCYGRRQNPYKLSPLNGVQADSFVFKTVFPRFHQLLKTTCRSLEDWVAHFTQVKWQDSESVLLCEIRRHASIGTVVARLWKKNTAVSFLDWLLGNKLKLVQFMVCLWHHHFMRNSSQRDSWHAHLLALWNRSLLSGCLSLLCQIEATRSAHCPGARSSHCRPHQFGSHKVFFENVAYD